MKVLRLLLLTLLALVSGTPAGAASHRPGTDGACDALLAKWKPRFEKEKLASCAAPPFVIAADGGPARLAQYRDGTILAAARCLWSSLFKARPSTPILILLFETEPPYRRLAKQWF